MYMAPEAARGAAHVTYASDVYSIGVMAYEMLTGKPPFDIPDEIAMHRHMYRLAHDAEYGPAIDRELLPTDSAYNFITQCTVRDATKRPTVEELLMHTFLYSVVGIAKASPNAPGPTDSGDAPPSSSSRPLRKSISQRHVRR